MIELSLLLVILALMAQHFLYVRETNKQIEKYMKALMAKDLQDYAVAKKIEEKVVAEKEEGDLVPDTEMDESLFTKMIAKTNKDEKEEDSG